MSAAEGESARAAAAVIGLAPLLVILLASALALWAAGTYAEHRAAVRAAETERHLEQFEEGPVARAWQRLSQARQAELRRDHGLLARIAASYQAPVGSVPYPLASMASTGNRVAADVDMVLQYFKRLALCIRMGSCDPAVTAARLGDLPWRFHSRHHRFLHEAHPREDLEGYLETISPRPGGQGSHRR